mmetsp:Transcript_49333/g.118672  ORF Transcript_49333/g.118672 Transcript_49333/m.118672 type:complete len:131 (-) Transcript_49333:256-648(-)
MGAANQPPPGASPGTGVSPPLLSAPPGPALMVGDVTGAGPICAMCGAAEPWAHVSGHGGSGGMEPGGGTGAPSKPNIGCIAWDGLGMPKPGCSMPWGDAQGLPMTLPATLPAMLAAREGGSTCPMCAKDA